MNTKYQEAFLSFLLHKLSNHLSFTRATPGAPTFMNSVFAAVDILLERSQLDITVYYVLRCLLYIVYCA
jgi:hypothetical protein